ncbi:MAG: hypothetical protein A7316_06280 [Candidatus Altiarchaeales archaeon WOR_SM1_86-2]|nr:MAG: hypothetical protein A7316_06280 [Candidatus Altiarchaeales archaeon WOR_SM1_86-2]ODS40405.1 MAG: hypothetical protein A7315_08590 [Candidatus Altiarchaeales archaeon WOR_SM1_79]
MPKPLPPTLRERNRYVVFEIISENNGFSKGDVSKVIQNASLRFLGELGVSKMSLWLIEWNGETRKGILKVNHKSVDEMRASIALIREINGKRAIFHVLGVSGTIKRAREKYY